jgi:hypothetical protein
VTPRASGVCIVGDGAWQQALARCVHGLGLPVLRLTTAPPDVALEQARTFGIASISVHDSLDRVDHAIADAALAVAVIGAPPDDAVLLVETRLVELLGRRHVVRAALDARVGAQARAGVIDDHAQPDAVAVLFVRGDHTVHVVRHRGQRVSRADTVIGVMPG